jgi:hypothetical protein
MATMKIPWRRRGRYLLATEGESENGRSGTSPRFRTGPRNETIAIET